MSQPIDPSTPDRIMIMLDEHDGEFQGTNQLPTVLHYSAKCKQYILRVIHRLEETGEITILRSCGGRGRKTVYKRNRNQPGLPRAR